MAHRVIRGLTNVITISFSVSYLRCDQWDICTYWLCAELIHKNYLFAKRRNSISFYFPLRIFYKEIPFLCKFPVANNSHTISYNPHNPLAAFHFSYHHVHLFLNIINNYSRIIEALIPKTVVQIFSNYNFFKICWDNTIFITHSHSQLWTQSHTHMHHIHIPIN